MKIEDLSKVEKVQVLIWTEGNEQAYRINCLPVVEYKKDGYILVKAITQE